MDQTITREQYHRGRGSELPATKPRPIPVKPRTTGESLPPIRSRSDKPTGSPSTVTLPDSRSNSTLDTSGTSRSQRASVAVVPTVLAPIKMRALPDLPPPAGLRALPIGGPIVERVPSLETMEARRRVLMCSACPNLAEQVWYPNRDLPTLMVKVCGECAARTVLAGEVGILMPIEAVEAA